MAFFKSSGVTHLIVGLGNPGVSYQNTRHNVGFMALDRLATDCNVDIDRAKYKGLTARVTIGEHKCLLLKPTTYMNLSGESVLAAMQYYKIPIERVLVFVDDISLEPGKLRIRRKGSHGGQNGLRNIIDLLGRDDFTRVKIGVGQKPHPDYDLASWVLSNFTPDEKKQIDEQLKHTKTITTLFLDQKLDQAMNRFNR